MIQCNENDNVQSEMILEYHCDTIQKYIYNDVVSFHDNNKW